MHREGDSEPQKDVPVFARRYPVAAARHETPALGMVAASTAATASMARDEEEPSPSPTPSPPPPAPSPPTTLHLNDPRTERRSLSDSDQSHLHFQHQHHPSLPQQHHHHHHPPPPVPLPHTHRHFHPSSLSLHPPLRPRLSIPPPPLHLAQPSLQAQSRPPPSHQHERHYSNRQISPPPYPLASRPRLLHTRSCPPKRGLSPPYEVHRQTSVPVAQRDLPQPVVDEDEHRRPNLQRNLSRTQTIKNYIRKSTVTFFGVDNENEDDQRRRWMERRRRMASKCYGQVKPDYQQQTSREDVVSLGGGAPSLDTPDSIVLPPLPPPSSRSWPRQVSRISDTAADGSITTVSSGVWLRHRPGRRQKESVARLTWDGLTYIASTVARRRPRTAAGALPTRPQATHTLSFPLTSVYDDSVFEDSADPFFQVAPQVEILPSPDEDSVTDDVFYDRIATPSPVSTPHLQADYLSQPVIQSQIIPTPAPAKPKDIKEIPARWRRSVPEPREVPDQEELSVGMKRMWKRITDQLFDNSNRRQYGMGVVGRYLRRSFRKERITSEVKEQLDDIDDHRPFFTYWVTTVQILITIISLAVYGFGPIGFEQTQRSGLVLVTSLSLQQVDYYEPDNFWVGPRAADLVHLGAKFAPCMRQDQNVFRVIESDRALERNTACCIRNDNSGCVQTSRDECSATISTWKKWSFDNTGPGGRISGSVCGQDPSYCSDPPSAPPYSWPDDITKWPICRRKVRSELSSHEHMACEVIGHPCCIGILGECHITTREYCDFVKGFFHEEAALCSQVSCLDDICGMIPFYNPDVPDQFYRLWTSLFLHAGLVHLSVSVLVQYFLMRDLEKLTGALRISLIYIVSGVAGNLASAIFVPYRAEVGPAGSQFGLLACLIVEVIHCWRMLKKPGIALLKLLVMVFILFILGLLPWIDNYAHLFGFIFGFLLSYALLPFVSFGVYDRRKKITLIWICLLLVFGLFAVLLLLFYIYPIYDCEFCKYLTCLPLTQNFCTTQGINITSRRHL